MTKKELEKVLEVRQAMVDSLRLIIKDKNERITKLQATATQKNKALALTDSAVSASKLVDIQAILND